MSDSKIYLKNNKIYAKQFSTFFFLTILHGTLDDNFIYIQV